MERLSIKAINLLIVLTFFITLIPEKIEAASYSAKVNASILNVRSKPSTKSTVIGKIKKGKVVTVQSTQNKWNKIKYGNKTGWVSAPYLTKITSNLGTYYVTASSLNVRQKASTSSKVISSVKRNSTVTLQQKSGSWGKIKTSNGKIGWVSLTYLSTKKPSANLGTYYVTASSLNVRAKASTSAKVIASVKRNATVTLQQKSGSWGKIKTSNGKIGWVSLTYLSTKKPSTNLGTYYVTASSLNVRAKASTSAKVISSVKRNAVVTLQQKKGSWGKIRTSNGKVGWVSLTYLSTKKTSDNLGTYYVTASSLNVRAKASISSKIIASVKRNAAVTLQQKSGSWGKIKTSNGKTGWVALKYISLKKPEIITTPTSPISNSVKGKVIVVDPGHGGRDPGAIGVYLKTKEKDINLSTANQLASLLKKAGAIVIMTRTKDTYLSLSSRAILSNNKKADAFVSIHYNNFTSKLVSGIETFYYHRVNQMNLASAIQGELIKATGLKNRGVKYGNYLVLRENIQPAALVELGFLSNPTEERVISQTSYHKKTAQAILNGLNIFFKQKK